MREVAPHDDGRSPDAASFAACLATILELELTEIPEAAGGESPVDWGTMRWLGSLGLGLVPVAEPATFAWAGPWIGRIRAPGIDGRRSVVMYGSPGGGVAWDPTGITGGDGWEIEDGFVVAALDVALARPEAAAVPTGAGSVVEIWVAPAAGAPARRMDEAQAIPGAGLAGDRHVLGTGTFPSGVPGSALTLIEVEVCESFEPALTADEHRRNLVTRGIDLNGLVGRMFQVGSLRCRGLRLCEPCVVIERYATRPLLRPLVHRGGLRADILDAGTIRAGDAVRAV